MNRAISSTNFDKHCKKSKHMTNQRHNDDVIFISFKFSHSFFYFGLYIKTRVNKFIFDFHASDTGTIIISILLSGVLSSM